MTTADLRLQCACGTVTGRIIGVSRANTNRLVCYCADCQAFARYLGHPDRVLDEAGGTEICQTSPARVKFLTGQDRLAVAQLSPDGLFRWHTDCCRTAIGNMMNSRGWAYVGLIHDCLPNETGGTTRDLALGPIRGCVNRDAATGDIEALRDCPEPPWRTILRSLRILVTARLRGDHRHSPFFAADGSPIASPHVLTSVERRAAYISRA